MEGVMPMEDPLAGSSCSASSCSSDVLFEKTSSSSLFDPITSFEWVTGETPFTSWEFLLAVHIVYGIGITLLQMWMKSDESRETPGWVKPYGYVHNLMMSALSFAMLVGILVGAWQTGRFSSLDAYTCMRTNGGKQPGLLPFSMYIFYLSKMLEFIDTALLILSKKKLIWLHKIHHLTTMSLVWHAMDSNLGFEITAGALNCFVHVIMYFYFAIPIKIFRSSITTTQISQFVLVLAACFYAMYRRVGGVGLGGEEGCCQGTFLAELHGLAMYGLYLVMFANFFIQQYLKPKPARNASATTTSETTSTTEPTFTTDNNKIGGELLLLPNELLEASALNALRILAKLLLLLCAGVVCANKLPEVAGAPLAVLFIATCLSWTYMIAHDCSYNHFFGRKFSFVDRVLAFLAAIPILRPMGADGKRRRLIGVSWSHLIMYLGAGAFVTVMLMKVGWWGLIKYWILPLAVMHFNVGSFFFSNEKERATYLMLFPELKNLLVFAVKEEEEEEEERKREEREKKREREEKEKEESKYQVDLAKIPFYNLDRALAWVNKNNKNPAFPRKAGNGVQVILDKMNQEAKRRGWGETVWSFSVLPYLGREMLLWKKRDYLLHAFVGLGVCAMFFNSISPFWGLAAIAIPLSLMFAASSKLTAQVHDTLTLLRFRNAIPAPTPAPAPTAPTASSSQPLLTVTQEELFRNTDWVSIENKVYHISLFAEMSHPGGDVIRACGGTDVTALFYSMHHRTSAKNLRLLNDKYLIGEMAPSPSSSSSPNFSFATPFAQDLQKEVYGLLKDQPCLHAPTQFWIRTILIIVSTLIFELHWAVTGSYISMVIVGFLHCQIGLAIQHDASHGALGGKGGKEGTGTWANDFFAYGADWIGNSRFLWFQQHIIGHHPHTNMAGVDPDVHSADPFLHFHAVPLRLRKFFHRYQWLYMFIVLPLYGPSVVWNWAQVFTLNHGDEVNAKANRWLRSRIPAAVCWRLFYYLRLVAVPYMVAGAPLAACMFGIPIVCGACLTFVFVVSHNFEGSERWPVERAAEEKKKEEAEGIEGEEAEEEKKLVVDWYKLQVETSCSYGGFISMALTGGLNFQIEHHLFPRVSSWYYPLIAPTVQKICEKHGVNYTYFPTLWENMVSCVRFMRQNGDAEVNDERVPEGFEGYKVGEEGEAELEEVASAVFTKEMMEQFEKREVLPVRIGGEVYNVKNFFKNHPGGDLLLHFLGKDATDVFYAMHSQGAHKWLKTLPIVNEKELSLYQEDFPPKNPTTPTTESIARGAKIDAGFRALRQKFIDQGLFKTSYMWYAYKSLSTVALGAGGLYLLSGDSGEEGGWMRWLGGAWGETAVSGFLVGMMLQQLGWVTHEAMHHQIFSDRNFANWVYGYPFGNFLQGFSVLWWKTRHNEHHASTNVMDKDPDIDTLPLLAWSKEDIVKAVKEEGKENNEGGAEVVEWQHWYAGPLLAHLHIIWQIQSLFFISRLTNCHNKKWKKTAFPETLSLVGHWSWRVLLVGWLCGWEWGRVALHWYIAELIGGSGIAGVVFCNHYPLEKLKEGAMDCWSEMQIDGTINMDPGVFNDWFCGGLNYQIEHHLFPTLPRHNLSAARPQVMKFCEEYGLPYRSEGMFPAVMSIFYFLRKMARNVPEVRKEVWGKKE